MTSLKPAKGLLLVAEPSIIGDVSFNRSVVLIAEYNENGSVGFILNKPLDYKLRDFVPEVNSKLPVYNGGPVEQDNLYFIHCIPDIIPGSIEISNGIYWGGDFESLKNLLNEDEILKTEIRFFLGYSGWSKMQLEAELQENNWLLIENKEKGKLLSKPANDFWKEKIKDQGGDYILFSNAPENPILN